MSECVCGHSEAYHMPDCRSAVERDFGGQTRLPIGGCPCKRFRDKEVFKFYCGYHERYERLPCAKD